MRQAVTEANELQVPLIVAGDLHDTKANLRGECVNAMLETFNLCKVVPYILIGNHDKINEKSEEHSLNFLSAGAKIISVPTDIILGTGNTWDDFIVPTLIPYQSNTMSVLHALSNAGSLVIMHQGLKSSNAGDYIQDHSALNKEDVCDFRVISGHYHTRQDIKIGRARKGAVGLWSYIGNPYTLTYGEANDPEKGFQILMSDGTLRFIPTNLRSHRVLLCDSSLNCVGTRNDGDLLWVKVTDTHENLSHVTRAKVQQALGIEHFKLDLIPLESMTTSVPKQPSPVMLDSLIDTLTNTGDEKKIRLKALWKRI